MENPLDGWERIARWQATGLGPWRKPPVKTKVSSLLCKQVENETI